MKLRQKLAVVMAAAMVVTTVPVVTMADTTNSISHAVNVTKGDTMGFRLTEEEVEVDGTTTTCSVYTINSNSGDYKYRYIPTLELNPTGTYDLTGTSESFFVDIENAKFSNEAFLAYGEGTLKVDKEGKIVEGTWAGKTPEEAIKTATISIPVESDTTKTTGTIEIKKISNTQLRVTVQNAEIKKGEAVKIPLFATAQGGEVTVAVDGTDSFVTSGKLVAGNDVETSKKVKATASEVEAITIDGGELNNIVLTENVLKAFEEAGQHEIMIELPASSDLEFKLENNTIKGDGGRGFASIQNQTMAARYVDGDRQVIAITIDGTVWKDPSARGTITLKGIKVIPQDKVASAGDVTVKVYDKKETLIADTTLKVATVSAYTVAATCAEPVALSAGKEAQTVSFTVKEAVQDTIVDGRRAEFTIENGFIAVRDYDKDKKEYKTALETFARLVNEKKITLPEEVKLEDVVEVKANKEGQITGFTVEFNNLDQDDVNELTFKMPIMADLNTTGEVKLSVEGRALPEAISTTIANVTSSVTVTTEAVQLKVGLNGQQGGKIVIAETVAKMLERGEVSISIPEGTGISFVKGQEVEVKAEGLKISEVKVSDKITFNVERTSETAGSITIEGIKFNVNRTTPEGTFALEIAGEALSTNEYIKSGMDKITVEDFIVIATANTEDLTQGGLKKGTASFTIDSSKYTVNGVEKEMDGKAYASNGRTMVPVRYVSEAFGIDGNNVLFNKGVITLMAGNRIVQLTNGSNIALVNGVSIAMDEKVTIKDGRTYVPMGEIGRLLGVNVTWDNETKTATFKN